MKIKILTIHSIHNFGSALQAFALEKYIADLGNDVEIIDYRPSYLSGGRNIIKTYLGRIINLKHYLSRTKKYDSFVRNYMKLSKNKYTSHKRLARTDNRGTLFIAGGDQLWNYYHWSGQDNAFKLDFVKKGTKIAFGTSMGRDNFSENQIKELAAKIADFKFVGVREYSSHILLKNMHVQNVHHVIDPVLLLDRSFYLDNIIEPCISGEYIVVYLVKKSKLLDDAIEYIRANTKYKIVHVCGFVKKCENDYFYKNTGPRELLGLINNAKLVISASFHATLFSIYLKKQFIALLPHENTNTRIVDLLNFLNLDDRIYFEGKNLPNMLRKDIDFTESNDKLNCFIEESKFLLNETLGRLNFRK